MDNFHPQLREKPRTPYTRVPSRSSTRTAPVLGSATIPPPSASRSPRQPSSHHPTHRFHHNKCTPRPRSPQVTPRPQIAREGSMDSTKQLAVSQYLQDELAKQRKVEVGRNTVMGNPEGTPSSTHLDRASRKGSSVWSEDSEGHRPRSSETDPAKASEMGLRDMRRTINQLTNENFDLKFELYHRREKQPQLEARVDALEAEKARLEEFNEKMLETIETRDKAIQEAVAMILTLEAKVEEMSRGLDAVRLIQADPFSVSKIKGYDNPQYDQAAPAPSIPDIPRQEKDSKSIQRMPSFMSDKSEGTDNLRKVYLTNQGSSLSLYRPSNNSSAAGYRSIQNGTMSPAMSTLSESSFPSVYGPRRGHSASNSTDICSPIEPRTFDGSEHSVGQSPSADETIRVSKTRQPARPRGGSGSRSHSQLPSISDMIQASPLQRIERLDPSNPKSASRPQSRDQSLHHGRPQSRDHARPQSRDQESIGRRSVQSNRSPKVRRHKEEKREALRRVVTDGPGGVRLGDFGLNLPPTPDTISSTTLRRFKTSDETLANPSEQESGKLFDGDLFNQKIDKDIFDVKASDTPTGVRLTEIPDIRPQSSQRRDFSNSSSTTTRTSNSFFPTEQFHQRRRSADDSTISQRRGNGWGSDYDDDQADVPSLVSSDIWMKESARPDWEATDRSASPDMFGFSTASGGWTSDAMYGRSTQKTPASATMGINESFPMQHGLFDGRAPPPPNRRSSLYGHKEVAFEDGTGHSNSHAIDTMKQKSTPNRVQRFMRRNSDAADVRQELKTPVQGSFPKPPADKKGHYPPQTRNGLTRLFRRSIGGSSKPDQSPQPQPAQEEVVVHVPKHERAISASWVSRSAAAMEEERTGATPPPILRNPRQGREEVTEYYRPRPITPDMESSHMNTSTPQTVVQMDGRQTPSYEVQGGAALEGNYSGGLRKKWLPFGRSNSVSLKNRIN